MYLKTLETFFSQELYELAQRKFLRQMTTYAASHDVDPYPRLFVADIVSIENPQTLDKSESLGIVTD